MNEELLKKHYYYDLPEELIAQTPIDKRDESRLLVLNRESGNLEHRVFKNIIEYLRPNDCLVINNTRVIPARLLGKKEHTGGAIEVFLLNDLGNDELWNLNPTTKNINSKKSNNLPDWDLYFPRLQKQEYRALVHIL